MTSRRFERIKAASQADAALAALIATLEDAFPGRMRGYYVHGSVADGTSIGTSDVDLDVVVKERFRDPHEQAELLQAAQAIAASSHLELDLEVTDEVALFAGAEPSFKLGSRPIYGEDIRPQVPLVPIEEWGRERMYRGYFLMVRVFHRATPVHYPIDFPDAHAEYCGYTERRVQLADGSTVPSTRDLSRVTGWLATALIAHEGKQYVARKRDCHRLYRTLFDDEWGALLEEIYASCRAEWNYLLPTDPHDREQLRGMCARVLDFENYFLTRFKPFLLTELQRLDQGEESRAVWLMREVPLEDDEVCAVLEGLTP